jgi:NhaA family Na+:H+ antiporter
LQHWRNVIPALFFIFSTKVLNTKTVGEFLWQQTLLFFSNHFMLGKRVPVSIKIFLTALAIVDDLGAIVVIAIFYTEKLETTYLLLSGLVILVLIILNFLKVKKHIFYLIPGVFLWYFMHHSGIHATIAGFY